MSTVVPFIAPIFFLFKVFVVLIHYYEYCGNRVVLAGLNRFTIVELYSSCYVHVNCFLN